MQRKAVASTKSQDIRLLSQSTSTTHTNNILAYYFCYSRWKLTYLSPMFILGINPDSDYRNMNMASFRPVTICLKFAPVTIYLLQHCCASLSLSLSNMFSHSMLSVTIFSISKSTVYRLCWKQIRNFKASQMKWVINTEWQHNEPGAAWMRPNNGSSRLQ